MAVEAHPASCSAMASDSESSSVRRRVDPLGPEATVDLINRVKGGDDAALERLLQRCIPALRRWASGRLPRTARGMLETVDLVQDAVMACMRRLDVFEVRHQGALQAYFRQAVMNRILDIVRQQRRRPDQVEMPEQLPDAAIQRLKPADREAIIGRIELQYSYDELAIVLDKPTAAAARVAVTRAMKRLADEMRHGR
jgi:RNA polymerase sigma-70 factor, ECF subfamily